MEIEQILREQGLEEIEIDFIKELVVNRILSELGLEIKLNN